MHYLCQVPCTYLLMSPKKSARNSLQLASSRKRTLSLQNHCTHMVVEIRPTNHMRPLCFHMLRHPGVRSRHAGGTTLLRHLLLEWNSRCRLAAGLRQDLKGKCGQSSYKRTLVFVAVAFSQLLRHSFLPAERCNARKDERGNACTVQTSTASVLSWAADRHAAFT